VFCTRDCANDFHSGVFLPVCGDVEQTINTTNVHYAQGDNMELNTMYLSKTGEAMRLIDIVGDEAHFALFDGEFVMNGPLEKMDDFIKATGMEKIEEDEYKLRVVAMRAFQDMKNDADYPYKSSYLGQYDEMKSSMSKEAIESFFEIGGGFRNYNEE
jgi:predicted RNA-binding protein